MPIIELLTSEETQLIKENVPKAEADNILLFFRELRAFLEVPIVDAALRKKFDLDTTKSIPNQDKGSIKPQKYNTETGEKIENKEATPPVKTPEELVIEQLATKEGRKSLSDGIENIKAMTGDVTLSEVQKTLTEGDNGPQKKNKIGTKNKKT